ncbi:MAG: N-acetyltransferase [Gammaproteobacteria bacterium]|nr:N-acetyltransferase [Gammaproteobacteria bacterium]
MKIEQITAIIQINNESWNCLVGGNYPFMRHEFLLALEESGCVSQKTGWLPQHLLVTENEVPVAVMPLYLKTHSRGEYVFDHQWVYAYEQYGRDYYPKLLTAIPFTPCQGMRMAVSNQAEHRQIIAVLTDFIKAKLAQEGLSSWHCLFPAGEQLELLAEQALAIREGVQFQWFNRGYHSFDDFLATLTASKRKMLKKERRKIEEQSINLVQFYGYELNDAQWRIFYDFYRMTYFKHGMSPYLNLDFFLRCAAVMGSRLLIVFAYKEGQPVAAALNFIGNDTLYGRYWRCREEYNFLHFETCYYQGLDYCIAHGLQRFDSGAQGEHKIARGFEPVTTYSAHWFHDRQFADAINQFLRREKSLIDLYKQDASRYLPFKIPE